MNLTLVKFQKHKVFNTMTVFINALILLCIEKKTAAYFFNQDY